MAVRDAFHYFVRRGLEKENWIITADPFVLKAERTFFKFQFVRTIIQRFEIKLLIYDPVQEVILEWIK